MSTQTSREESRSPLPITATTDNPCDYVWGDWQCKAPEGHEDGRHRFVWHGDEDDEG